MESEVDDVTCNAKKDKDAVDGRTLMMLGEAILIVIYTLSPWSMLCSSSLKKSLRSSPEYPWNRTELRNTEHDLAILSQQLSQSTIHASSTAA